MMCSVHNKVARLAGIALGTFALIGFASHAEAAQTQLALDLDFANPIAEPESEAGAGGALRLGQQLDMVAFTLTGEVGASYHSFGGDDNPTLTSGFAGGRVRIGKIIEPGAFVHLGASRLSNQYNASWAPVLDVGLSLDLTVFPLVDLGLHATYVHRFDNSKSETFEYVVVGPHVALVF